MVSTRSRQWEVRKLSFLYEAWACSPCLLNNAVTFIKSDCYVAACGVPDRRPDHAVAVCRFALKIMVVMETKTRELEGVLGPDTANLKLRIGVNSGPITAGVIRGAQARFQLFGDTVNTCSRVETTGQSGRIHLSHETARQLIETGKARWVKKRKDLVTAKGKGTMQTYWLQSELELEEF